MSGGKLILTPGKESPFLTRHMAQLARIKLNYGPQLLFQVLLYDSQLKQLPHIMCVCVCVLKWRSQV